MIRSLICGTFVLLLVISGQAWSVEHLNITEVFVDDQNNPTSIMITGKEFLSGTPLEVTLGELGLLAIIGSTDTLIEAMLPGGILPGDYSLTVSTDACFLFEIIQRGARVSVETSIALGKNLRFVVHVVFVVYIANNFFD